MTGRWVAGSLLIRDRWDARVGRPQDLRYEWDVRLGVASPCLAG